MEAGQDAVLTARLSDAVRMAEQKNRCHFVGFLDEREAEIARSVMRRLRFDRFLLWGGHEEAERVLFGAFPSYLDPEPSAFPLAAITARFRREDALSHRDFMGGLLSRGLQREALGDILLEEGRAVFFCARGGRVFSCWADGKNRTYRREAHGGSGRTVPAGAPL